MGLFENQILEVGCWLSVLNRFPVVGPPVCRAVVMRSMEELWGQAMQLTLQKNCAARVTPKSEVVGYEQRCIRRTASCEKVSCQYGADENVCLEQCESGARRNSVADAILLYCDLICIAEAIEGKKEGSRTRAT